MSAIAADVAADMVADWARQIGAVLSDDGRVRITRAVEAGRLDYDDGRFRYRLAAQLKLDTGETLEVLTVSEPNGRQLREAGRGGRDQMDSALHLLSAVTDQPIGVIDRIGQRDILALTELVGFFG